MGGTSKSSILMGCSSRNHPLRGYPHFGKPPNMITKSDGKWWKASVFPSMIGSAYSMPVPSADVRAKRQKSLEDTRHVSTLGNSMAINSSIYNIYIYMLPIKVWCLLGSNQRVALIITPQQSKQCPKKKGTILNSSEHSKHFKTDT